VRWRAVDMVSQALVAFAFFGMNAVGIEIENPFGEDANDLPMSKMRERGECEEH
jgi:putative membrane protein